MGSLVDEVVAGANVAEVAKFAEVAAERTLSISLKVGVTLALILGGFILARLAAGAIRARFGKLQGVDQTLVPILAQSVRYAIIFVTLVMVLSNFGIETTSIIAVLGAAGLAIGLALQGTLQNVAAGIMLLTIRPFRKGDYIEAGSVGGTVDETGLFMTRMHTPQGLFIAVPNSIIWSNVITNYSRMPRRRFDLLVGISYDADIDVARDVILNLLLADGRVHRSPEPIVVVRALGASSVDLELRAWTDGSSYWDLNFDMTRKVKLALDEAGISIPYPHTQIVLSPEILETLSSANGATVTDAEPQGKPGGKPRGRPRSGSKTKEKQS